MSRSVFQDRHQAVVYFLVQIDKAHLRGWCFGLSAQWSLARGEDLADFDVCRNQPPSDLQFKISESSPQNILRENGHANFAHVVLITFSWKRLFVIDGNISGKTVWKLHCVSGSFVSRHCRSPSLISVLGQRDWLVPIYLIWLGRSPGR